MSSQQDYWKDCIAEAASECELALKPEQLDALASAAESGHEHYGMAFYSPPWSDRVGEIERESAGKLKRLQAEPGELPPLPLHPGENAPVTGGYEWSPREQRAIRGYARLALATSPLPKERVERVMDAVRHYGYLSPIDHDDGAADALAAVRAILEGRV